MSDLVAAHAIFEDLFESVGDLVGLFMPQVPYQEVRIEIVWQGQSFVFNPCLHSPFQLDHLVPASLNFRWKNVQQKIHIMLKALKTIAFSTTFFIEIAIAPCVLVAVRKEVDSKEREKASCVIVNQPIPGTMQQPCGCKLKLFLDVSLSGTITSFPDLVLSTFGKLFESSRMFLHPRR